MFHIFLENWLKLNGFSVQVVIRFLVLPPVTVANVTHCDVIEPQSLQMKEFPVSYHKPNHDFLSTPSKLTKR